MLAIRSLTTINYIHQWKGYEMRYLAKIILFLLDLIIYQMGCDNSKWMSFFKRINHTSNHGDC